MVFLRRIVFPLIFFSLPAFAGSEVQGIRNFYQVDAHVYRGGQPTNEGFKYLAKIGVKTVLDLREDDRRSAAEQQAVTALGMHYVNVPMTGLTPPTEAQILKILTLLEGNTSDPVFVHCKRGADRTGAVIAAYRIDHDRWDNAKALKEAMSDGMSFFQFPRQAYIRNFKQRVLETKSTVKTAEAAVSNSATPATAIAAPSLAR